jgi:hypothetical protein
MKKALVGRILPIFIYFKEEISIVFLFKFFNYTSVIKNERRRKEKSKRKKRSKKRRKSKEKTKPCNTNLLSSI